MKRPANQIYDLASEILDGSTTPDGSILTPADFKRLSMIRTLAKSIRADTGTSDEKYMKAKRVVHRKPKT